MGAAPSRGSSSPAVHEALALRSTQRFEDALSEFQRTAVIQCQSRGRRARNPFQCTELVFQPHQQGSLSPRPHEKMNSLTVYCDRCLLEDSPEHFPRNRIYMNGQWMPKSLREAYRNMVNDQIQYVCRKAERDREYLMSQRFATPKLYICHRLIERNFPKELSLMIHDYVGEMEDLIHVRVLWSVISRPYVYHHLWQRYIGIDLITWNSVKEEWKLSSEEDQDMYGWSVNFLCLEPEQMSRYHVSKIKSKI